MCGSDCVIEPSMDTREVSSVSSTVLTDDLAKCMDIRKDCIRIFYGEEINYSKHTWPKTARNVRH